MWPISLCCALSPPWLLKFNSLISMITGIDDLLKLKFLQFFFQLLTSIIQDWIQTVDLISKTQSQQNNSCRFQNNLCHYHPSIHPSPSKSPEAIKLSTSMSSIIRYCMLQYWSPGRVVCSLRVHVGFHWVSYKIQRHTWQVNWRLWVSVHMNICVCHLCDGLAICPGYFPAYDPGKAPASPWPYIGKVICKMYEIDGCTVL